MSRVALINTSSQYTEGKINKLSKGRNRGLKSITERWNPSAWG